MMKKNQVFRFESFKSEVKRLCSLTGSIFCGIPHHNRSVHNHYRTYYSERTRSVVERVYKEDIEFFGYSF